MPIDLFGSEQHFRDHLAPIWDALEDRGTFYALGDPVDESDNPIMVVSYGDLKKVRRAGRTRIALGEHGYGQSYGGHPDSADHGSYAGGQDRDDVSLFLVPNQHAAERNRHRHPTVAIAVVGCAKLDELPKRQLGPGPVVALSFHFDAHSVGPEATGTLRHYKAAFPALTKEFSVIGHGHPRSALLLARHYKRYGIEYVPDFADVCRRADIYAFDNSSTGYEFASTGRPVVVLNGPQYRRNVEHGLRFWDAADVGVQVDTPEGLVDAVALAVSDPPSQRDKREEALAMVYAYRKGGAQRVVDALMEWAG